MEQNHGYDILEITKQLTPIFRSFDVKRASVFGSYASGTAKEESDINLLVELDDSFGLQKFDALQQEIEKTLKKEIDLLEYDSVVDLMVEDILGGAVLIYEKG